MKREIRNLKMIWAGLLALLLSVPVWAGDARLSITPKVIDLSDRAQLTVEFVDVQPQNITFPQIDGLSIEQYGTSSSTRTEIIAGHRKMVVAQQYTYIVTPSKPGKFEIGPVTMEYKGGSKQATAQLEVVNLVSELLFARITCNNPSPSVYGALELEYKIYARQDLRLAWKDRWGRSLFSIESGFPEDQLGDIQLQKLEKIEREVINGKTYNVTTLSIQCKPLESGTLSFRPLASIYAQFPASVGLRDKQVRLQCDPLDLEVQPIPLDGRPASYSGAIGTFNFSAEIDQNQITQNAWLNLKMNISGAGNIGRFTPPVLEETPQLKTDNISKLPSPRDDLLLFEQPISPTSTELHEIPAVTFSWYDPEAQTFRTVTRGPFPIEVKPAPKKAAQVVSSMEAGSQTETKVIERDIAYLKPAPRKWIEKGETSLVGKWILPLPLLAIGIVGAFDFYRRKQSGNVARSRRQEAPKAARKQLHRAEKAMKNGEAAAFDEALWNALAEYFGNRLNLAPGEITLGTVQSAIPEEAEKIAHLFSSIEQRRYGLSASSEGEMQNLLDQLNELLKACERTKS